MKVCIVHDSQQGNGRKIAERMGEVFESLGASVVVGHQTETTPESIASQSPDLLVIGAAIRKFMTGPASKRWMSRLAAAVKDGGDRIACGAVFITHLMPKSIADRRAGRFSRNIMSYNAVRELYSEWFSGPVQQMKGPLVEGTLEASERHARVLFEWVQSVTTEKSRDSIHDRIWGASASTARHFFAHSVALAALYGPRP